MNEFTLTLTDKDGNILEQLKVFDPALDFWDDPLAEVGTDAFPLSGRHAALEICERLQTAVGKHERRQLQKALAKAARSEKNG